MPKKQAKNSFYFFMRDFKEEQEQRGFRFTNGMKEVAELAGPVWKELPPDERLHYENMAAECKLKEKGDLTKKYTTMGISYAQLEREEYDRKQMELRMVNEIRGTVQPLGRETTLPTQIFYFIHFNYYCRIDDGSYLVCEVAVAQFNLLEGVKDVCHCIIRRDKIPTGYTYAAKQNSEDTHKIPLPHDLEDDDEVEPYGREIFLKIKSFIERTKTLNGDLPPLYTVDQNVEVSQTTLTELGNYNYPEYPDIFRVYPLSKLFFYLRNAAATPGFVAFPVETLAMRELDKDQYNFAPGISCKMHEKEDSCVYCSKSMVTRWAYLICDHCCKDLKIPMSRGRHVPYNADITEYKPKSDNGAVRRWPKTSDSSPIVSSAAHIAKEVPKKEVHPVPLRAVDLSKAGPSKENAHLFNINAASAPSVRITENCWRVENGGPLRHPKTLPPSVQNALQFSNDDFPSLGSRNHVKKPAAVAGRGCGIKILMDEREPPAPGGLRKDSSARQAAAGRGHLLGEEKKDSTLTTNLGGLNLN